MVSCCYFAIAVPSNFIEPCQGDVIAAELSGQQGGSSRAKECLDIPCGDSGSMTKADPYSLVGGRLG
ncbi:solute carrier organic anion transporter family member 3A1 isoform X3, partial [Tachysurus ichikawai]